MENRRGRRVRLAKVNDAVSTLKTIIDAFCIKQIKKTRIEYSYVRFLGR
jgi:hypothetical protein